jgi:hypothetical protein
MLFSSTVAKVASLFVKLCNLNNRDENCFISSTEKEDTNAKWVNESKFTGEG